MALTQVYRAHSGGRLVAEHRPRVVVPVAEYPQHVLHVRRFLVRRQPFVPAFPGHATPVAAFVRFRVLRMKQPAQDSKTHT